MVIVSDPAFRFHPVFHAFGRKAACAGNTKVIPLQPMKVAISLPDPLFSAAEHLAEQLHVSRSQLYAQALSEFLEKRQDSVITQRLNAVYGEAAESVDAGIKEAQLKVLGNEAW